MNRLHVTQLGVLSADLGILRHGAASCLGPVDVSLTLLCLGCYLFARAYKSSRASAKAKDVVGNAVHVLLPTCRTMVFDAATAKMYSTGRDVVFMGPHVQAATTAPCGMNYNSESFPLVIMR